MSGLQARGEDQINGVDVREQGSALRVATNTPHLVSLGTGRLSTAVTLHPIKQGRVTIGSDPTCDIYVVGTGVASVHCHVENSHNVVTLYPLSGSTLLDGLPVDRPTRLSQGSMLTIGRSNYLRFNHPEEAMLMKSVLPSTRVSMAPVQYQPNEQCQRPGFQTHNTDTNQQCYQANNVNKVYKDSGLTQLDQELDMTLKEMSRKKPPVVPRKPYRDLELSDSNSDQESRPKVSSIMAKVSKFEYYAKQQKNVGRSQFYTSNENDISPKVFSSNSLTVNTPAKDVLGTKNMPNYMNKLKQDQKVIHLTENNISDSKTGSYANVAIRNKTKIDDIVRNFDENSRLPKKINNDQHTIENTNLYGKINTDNKNNFECANQTKNVSKESTAERNEVRNNFYASKNAVEVTNDLYGKIPERNANVRNLSLPSPSFDRNPQYSPVYANCTYDRGLDAESKRFKGQSGKMKSKTKKEKSPTNLLELFVKNLQKNTLALKQLKLSIDLKNQNENYEKIIDITKSVDEKLDVVHKLRNDIKIYRTINTILTNHYIKQTKDHEGNIDEKILKLEKQIRQSYEDLRGDIRQMIKGVPSDKNANISAPIQNSNVIFLGNDVKWGQFNELYMRNEMYNDVIKKIDKLFDVMAYQDRIKEEEQKQAETARLEEILTMCAEYERQIASGVPITPTEKRPHNKIITNGSLPRSVALNNPNFVQTSEGYYKFETSQHRNNSLSQSLPMQRNLSSYENFDPQSPHDQRTPEVTISTQSFENSGRMDEIGIPVFDNSPKHELSSPIMIRKIQNGGHNLSTSPIGSPYENLYYNRSNALLKPKSPNTNSPRTRIKTTFAHKNLPSPQYFVFPTPPPKDNSQIPEFNQKSDNTVNFNQSPPKNKENLNQRDSNDGNCNQGAPIDKKHFSQKDSNETNFNQHNPKDKQHLPNENACKSDKVGIEKQLSLEEEIPMIDDADFTNDLEFRISKIVTEKDKNNDVTEKQQSPKNIVVVTQRFIEKEIEQKETEVTVERLTKNKSFDDVKKELMADIPELEEFEKDLKENRREKIMKNLTEDMRKMDVEADSIDSVLDDTAEELKTKYDRMKEERKKFVAEIHEIKCKMSEIRSQEDDILRELEMEKALIKGEYDSEIAILNIEQKKKTDLLEKAKQIEEEIRQLKERQEARQNEMRDRVEIATLKVERIEKDLKENTATIDELQFARDILDHETKIFEDLEFQHLEEESELLANREDLQNEIIILTKKIEAQKSRILTLKSEANDNLTSALDETKVLQAEYVRLLNEVEEITSKVQAIEKELKPIVNKLNDIERTQSPDSAFYTDQTRAKSGEFGYSPQSSDSDDFDITKISEHHTNKLKDKFNSIDQMSQSMIVDIERRVTSDVIDDTVDENNKSNSESPSKSSTPSKEKKGFWERNFDSLKRKKKQKSPEKIDIMSQSLNENMFYNNENIENDNPFDKFNSLRHSKNKKDKQNGPVKSSSSSKIPTFAALGKIIKKDSVKKKNENIKSDNEADKDSTKNRYVKHVKTVNTDNKYMKAKSSSPDKSKDETIKEEQEDLEDTVKNNITIPYQQNIKYQTLGRHMSMEQKDMPKILHRKSCGDEPSIKNNVAELQKISDSGKIPSQDDIDRISKVTMDAPILSSDTDMNSLGKRTLDSLMEIERKRMVMLEEQGCQVIENEREKISELKRRVQDETKKLWDQKYREQSKSLDSECHSLPSNFETRPIDGVVKDGGDVREKEDSMMDDSFNMTNSMLLEESSGLMSSIEDLQVRNSRTESTEEDKRSDDSRPLSHASDFSRDNILSLGQAPRRSRRAIAPCSDAQRPLTRYLPVDRDDFDLRAHIDSAGHQVELCPYVTINSTSCRGYLHKLGAKFHTWSKRWFVFDRESKTFVYYWDKSEKKPRGGAYFQVIEEVYLDHGNTSKSPSPQTTFIVKTRQRRYYLMAPSGEAARIWIDVIFTGAQGYTEYLE